jgi:hypothetical protein
VRLANDPILDLPDLLLDRLLSMEGKLSSKDISPIPIDPMRSNLTLLPKFKQFFKAHWRLLLWLLVISALQGVSLVLGDVGLQILDTNFEPHTWVRPGELPAIPSITVWHYIQQRPQAISESLGRSVIQLFSFQIIPVMIYVGLSHDRKERRWWALFLWAWPLVIPYGAVFSAIKLDREAVAAHRNRFPHLLLILAIVLVIIALLPLALVGFFLLMSIPLAIADGGGLLIGDMTLDGPMLTHGTYYLAVVGYFELFWLGVSLGDAFPQWRKAQG